MKKLLFILLLMACAGLSAQDNIIIPKGADTLYRVLVTPWYGLDLIETKDGNFILPAKVLKDLETFEVKLKAAQVTRDNKAIKPELEKLPVKDIKNIVLKVTEEKITR